jgi:hypothetical protein
VTAAAIVTRVRELGADFRIVDGQLRLRRASRVPAELVDQIRVNKDAIRAAIETPNAQIPLIGTPTAPKHNARKFLDHESARFDELMRRYHVPLAPNQKRRAAR